MKLVRSIVIERDVTPLFIATVNFGSREMGVFHIRDTIPYCITFLYYILLLLALFSYVFNLGFIKFKNGVKLKNASISPLDS